MAPRPRLEPGPEHPITVTPCEGRVVATRAGHTLVDTDRALLLTEAGYPPVHYLPREDADLSLLQRIEQTSYCPYKGQAGYYSIVGAGPTAEGVCWTYESPYDAVAPIRGHLAFYPGEVDLRVTQQPHDPAG